MLDKVAVVLMREALMPKENYSDLLALVAVARERSFTRAAAQLGMSQSMLSRIIKTLEADIGVRLLTRTTRSVSLTEAGEQLLAIVEPSFSSIASELVAATELGVMPAGYIQLTATDHVVTDVLWPKLAPVLARHPKIDMEFIIDYGLRDILAAGIDFGVRLGSHASSEMQCVRISPQTGLSVVGAATYFDARPMPTIPQDLAEHDCINLRLPTRGGLYPWEFEKDGAVMNVRVKGQLTFNSIYPILEAALAGSGLAYLPDDLARPYLQSGALISVLQPWCRQFKGLYLYYSKQHEVSRAMQVIIDALAEPEPVEP